MRKTNGGGRIRKIVICFVLFFFVGQTIKNQCARAATEGPDRVMTWAFVAPKNSPAPRAEAARGSSSSQIQSGPHSLVLGLS